MEFFTPVNSDQGLFFDETLIPCNLFREVSAANDTEHPSWLPFAISGV